MLASLGNQPGQNNMDGIDLNSAEILQARQRQVSTALVRKLRPLEETDLEISGLVEQNRAYLKLDDEQNALWGIGPYDEFRGQAMDVVCEKHPTRIRPAFGAFRPLSTASTETAIPAYVTGKCTGAAVTLDSKPFLITSQGLIVASGYTWAFNDRSRFFALVEPKIVKQSDWDPRAWLVEEGKCMGAKES